eukprot:8669924-Pyramimonas_sp.AAC.1
MSALQESVVRLLRPSALTGVRVSSTDAGDQETTTRRRDALHGRDPVLRDAGRANRGQGSDRVRRVVPRMGRCSRVVGHDHNQEGPHQGGSHRVEQSASTDHPDFVRHVRGTLRMWRNECVVSRRYIDLVPEEIRGRLFPTIHFQTSSTTRSTALLPCPVDGCRGIVMLPAHACGLCTTTLCPHCHSVCSTASTSSTSSTFSSTSEAVHVCDPKDIQTVAEILRNTRACPKCATRIHRIDGCDQMWCTRCHTAFHWQNGQ